jgi:hypothetical protein
MTRHVALLLVLSSIALMHWSLLAGDALWAVTFAAFWRAQKPRYYVKHRDGGGLN